MNIFALVLSIASLSVNNTLHSQTPGPWVPYSNSPAMTAKGPTSHVTIPVVDKVMKTPGVVNVAFSYNITGLDLDEWTREIAALTPPEKKERPGSIDIAVNGSAEYFMNLSSPGTDNNGTTNWLFSGLGLINLIPQPASMNEYEAEEMPAAIFLNKYLVKETNAQNVPIIQVVGDFSVPVDVTLVIPAYTAYKLKKTSTGGGTGTGGGGTGL
jgi:hypothetical protein